MLAQNRGQNIQRQSCGILSSPIPFTLRRPSTIRCPHSALAAAPRAAAAATKTEPVDIDPTAATIHTSPSPSPKMQERGLEFTLEGNAFYRHESAQGRDLAVLLAAVYKRQTGRLNVLDVMAGSGVRGARYLNQAGADMVWCNDGNKALHTALVHNLCSAASVPLTLPNQSDGLQPVQSSQAPQTAATTEPQNPTRERAAAWDMTATHVSLSGLRGPVWQWEVPQPQQHQTSASQQLQQKQQQQQQQAEQNAASDFERNDGSSSTSCGPNTRVRVSHLDANRVLASCYLEQDWYDLIDIDSFGSDSSTVGAAIDAVCFNGGMLYLTSTDGFTSGGHRPERSLASYGAYLRAVPWSNEQGLRMLIGNAVQVAASRGVSLTPLFSLYSFHGPVFRVMLRAEKSPAWPSKHYGFAGHCHVHGSSSAVSWTGLNSAVCRCLTLSKQKSPGGNAGSSSNSSEGVNAGQATTSVAQHPSSDSNTSHQDCSSRKLDAAAADLPNSSSSSSSSLASPVLVNVSSATESEPSTSAAPGQNEGARPATPLVLTGPMWTGPLHDADAIIGMTREAEEREWLGLDQGVIATGAKGSRKHSIKPLGDLLAVMLEECDARLPPGYVMVGDVSRQLARAPGRDLLIAALSKRGFAASRCHLEAMAFRTNASMGDILLAAVEDLRIARRAPPSDSQIF